MIGDVPYLVPLHSHNTGRRSLFCPISPFFFTGATPVLMRLRDFQVLKSRRWLPGQIWVSGKSSGEGVALQKENAEKKCNYSRTLLRSLSREQRIRDSLSGKLIKSYRIVTSTLNIILLQNRNPEWIVL
jgi:hypothetical protein